MLSIIALLSWAWINKNQGTENDWSDYLGGSDRNHYSTLRQITPTNVGQLKVAWTFALPDSGQMQVNPLIAMI